MTRIPRWARIGVIVAAYLAVAVYGAVQFHLREVQEAAHPEDVNASAGMYAFGDMMLAMYVAILFLIPTGLLLWFLFRHDKFSQIYFRFLLVLSFSSPVCLALFCIRQVAEPLNLLCFMRLSWSPVVLAGIGVSRLTARLPRAKRLISYAFLTEALTLIVIAVLVLHLKPLPR